MTFPQRDLRLACEYCGTARAFAELESRDIGLVCCDADECRDAEAKAHRAHLAELRKRRRDGDDLTDAEREELSDD